jgi:NADH-quinone oxidoreductase subunit C
MSFDEILERAQSLLGQGIQLQRLDGIQCQILVDKSNLISLVQVLKSDRDLRFDVLSCITAIDNGQEKGTIDMVYNFNSIANEHRLTVLCSIEKGIESKPAQIDSLCSLYKAANWHEREIFDFFGVHFNHHPDLRRIFLPNDWEGYPLLKDYKHQEYYRGIKVDNSTAQS